MHLTVCVVCYAASQSGALLATLDLHNTTCCHITKLL